MCLQHLFIMPPFLGSVLTANICSVSKHVTSPFFGHSYFCNHATHFPGTVVVTGPNVVGIVVVVGVGIGLTVRVSGFNSKTEKGKRIGMIGLDTGHCEAFTSSLNDPLAGDKFLGYKVVAAYPKGTEEIIEWKNNLFLTLKQIFQRSISVQTSTTHLLYLFLKLPR